MVAEATSTQPRATGARALVPGSSANPLLGPALPTTPSVPDGPGVKRAEGILKKLGYDTGRPDEDYNARTARNVRAFQKAVGLPETGELDSRTMARMRGALKHKRHGTESVGQRGEAVKRNEQRLKRLGYDVGAADGTYDQQTAAAMKEFKTDQKIGGGNRPRTGLASERTQRILDRETDKLAHQPYRVRVKPSQQRRADDREVARALRHGPLSTANSQDASRDVKRLRREATETIQRTLRRAGYDPKHIEGRFDERTAGMVKEFQRKSGLTPTGEVDARTWSKLKNTTMETRSPTSPRQAIGEVDSGAVKKTEQMLKKLGHRTGDVDGDYTRQTERAVDAFRRKHHMPETDGVGGGTLARIRKEYKKKMRPDTSTVAGCAKILLRSGNVSFWTGLSTGSDRANMERLARGQPAIVNGPDPVSDRTVKPPLAMMKALVDMSRRGPFTITALTGGDHSSSSKHYRGLAVDVSPGAPAGNIGRFGGRVYNEGDHLHLYWGPGGP